MRKPWQFKVIFTRSGQGYTVNDPTLYRAIISNASIQKKKLTATGFKLLVVSLKTSQPLKAEMVSVPMLTYINDYGARVSLTSRCEGSVCKVDKDQNSRG